MGILHKYASQIAKLEGGKSESNIGDIRQILKLLKEQHRKSRRGSPSILRQLAKEAGWNTKKK